eukprot:364226-Chlamydomonas_euryale.AAC.3
MRLHASASHVPSLNSSFSPLSHPPSFAPATPLLLTTITIPRFPRRVPAAAKAILSIGAEAISRMDCAAAVRSLLLPGVVAAKAPVFLLFDGLDEADPLEQQANELKGPVKVWTPTPCIRPPVHVTLRRLLVYDCEFDEHAQRRQPEALTCASSHPSSQTASLPANQPPASRGCTTLPIHWHTLQKHCVEV